MSDETCYECILLLSARPVTPFRLGTPLSSRSIGFTAQHMNIISLVQDCSLFTLRVIITHVDNNETKLTYLLTKQAERPKSNISRKRDKPIAHSLPYFFCSSSSRLLSSRAANSSCAVTFFFWKQMSSGYGP